MADNGKLVGRVGVGFGCAGVHFERVGVRFGCDGKRSERGGFGGNGADSVRAATYFGCSIDSGCDWVEVGCSVVGCARNGSGVGWSGSDSGFWGAGSGGAR